MPSAEEDLQLQQQQQAAALAASNQQTIGRDTPLSLLPGAVALSEPGPAIAEVDEHASEKDDDESDEVDAAAVHAPGEEIITPSTAVATSPASADGSAPAELLPAGGLPTSGTGEDACIKFQLIPISETPGKAAVGEVVERKLKEKDAIKIGRQVLKDGQATIKGNKKATEFDIWFSSKVVSRLHAEIWTKDGQLCIKDVGSSSGTFLNQMRLSPSGKESRPYPLKQGDVIQFGVDFKGKADADIYRAVTMRLGFHDQAWLKAQRKNANPQRFSAALKQLIAATNPYGETKVEEGDSGDTDCCICIGPIAPFQALFIAPCSHCYHYKCVGYLVVQSPMFQCPLCRQVANLTASVSSESLNGENKIVVPLPVLEDELEPKKVAEQPAPARRASTSRRPSLAGAKKLMENMGFLTRVAPQAIAEPVNEGEGPVPFPSDPPVASPSPASSSPAGAASSAANPAVTRTASLSQRASRSFSFKIRGFSRNEKQQDPAAAAATDAVPRALLSNDAAVVDDPRAVGENSRRTSASPAVTSPSIDENRM